MLTGVRPAIEYCIVLDAVNTGSTCVNLAVSALENPPVRTRMTDIAGPLNQSTVRFDHLERVGAVRCDGHGDSICRYDLWD